MPKRKSDTSAKGSDAKKLKQSTLFGSSNSNSSGTWTDGSSMLIYKDPAAKASSKVLALDLDGTIITPASGRVFAKDANDWKLLSPQIPSVLKRFADDGYAIVIMSNQGGLEKSPEKRVPELKKKFEAVCASIGVPMRGYFAILNDANRKPRVGMWEALEADNDGIEIDRSTSIYCGDAAGRNASGKDKKDHSHCDRLFAENIGVTFKTPEELWDGAKRPGSDSTYPLLFNPKELAIGKDGPGADLSPVPPTLRSLSSTDSSAEEKEKKKPILVLMVGYPASGKSTFCANHLTKLGFEVVNRDTLKDMKKCVARCDQLLKAGSSVVVDNTNVNPTARSPFLAVAKALGVPTYACVMQTSLDHSRHNEVFRQLVSKGHSKISSMIFNTMKSSYQAPTKAEGFEEIFEVPFVPNLESESHRKLYFMHLLEK